MNVESTSYGGADMLKYEEPDKVEELQNIV